MKEGSIRHLQRMKVARLGDVDRSSDLHQKECHTLPHYWFQFLAHSPTGAITGSGVAFMVFFYKEIGLGLKQISPRQFVCAVGFSAALMIGTGWLADRIHPMRVVIIGVLANMFVGLPIMVIWLFWRPGPEHAFWMMVVISILITAPIAALAGIWDPPLFMRLFPRSRYGQFCSANSIWRSVGSIIGVFRSASFSTPCVALSVRRGPSCSFLSGNWFSDIPATWMTWKLYQSWKRHGGDKGYVPPVPDLAGNQPVMAMPSPAA